MWSISITVRNHSKASVYPFNNCGSLCKWWKGSQMFRVFSQGNFMFLFCDISCLLGGSRKGLALKGLVPDKEGSSSEGVGIGSAGGSSSAGGSRGVEYARCEEVCDLLINSSVIFLYLVKTFMKLFIKSRRVCSCILIWSRR